MGFLQARLQIGYCLRKELVFDFHRAILCVEEMLHHVVEACRLVHAVRQLGGLGFLCLQRI